MLRLTSITLMCLVFSAYTAFPSLPYMMCNINVNAGPDITICLGESGNLNGMVTGDWEEYEWSPPTGLSDPFDLNTSVTATTTTVYTLTARGIGDNLIQNGGFESGSINPSTTAFNFVPQNSFAGSAGGSYTIGTSATFGNIFGCSAFAGNYAMAYNGSGSAGAAVWCQTVPVNPNAEYKFEMYFMAVNIPFITTPPAISVTINGQAVTAAGGGATCAWAAVNGTWNSGAAASATVCINNSNGSGSNYGVLDEISLRECCVVEDQVTVNVVDIQALAQPAGPITCDNPTLILSGAGSSTGAGYTYEWTTSDGRIINGFNTLNPTIGAPGTYTLTVFGPGGCEDEITVVIDGSVTPPDVRTFTDILSCDDPNGRVGAQSNTPNVDFMWTGPNGFVSFDQSFVTDVPGKYYVRVEDQYNCWTIDSIEVLDERAIPMLDILGDTISCGKDSATLEGLSTSWNLTYSWEGPNMITSDSSAITTGDTGRYILTVVDSNDCVAMDTFYVIETDLPFSAFAEADTIDCNNTFATLRGFSDSMNVDFSWEGPNGFTGIGPIVSTTDSGTYILTVNFQGCLTRDTIEVIKEAGVPDLSLIGDTINCLQDSATLFGFSTTPGATISWAGPNGFTSNDTTITIGENGTYILTVTGANGCEVIDSFEVTRDTLRPDTFSLLGLPTVLDCNNDSAVLFVQGSLSGVILEWTGPSGPIVGLPRPRIGEPGIYQLTATNPNGCSRTETVEITSDFARPSATVVNDTITCTNANVTLQVNPVGTVNYEWSGPNGFSSQMPNPSVQTPGIYSVILTGENGCDSTFNITVSADTLAPSFALTEDTLDCSQPSVTLQVNTTDAGTYTWNGPNGFTSNDPSPMIQDSGWYVLTLTGDNGCFTTDSVNIKRTEDTPDIAVTGDTITCLKDSAIISGVSTSPNVSFQWDGPNGYNSNQASNVVREGGRYTFTVLNMAGCSSTLSVDVVVDTVSPEIVSVSADAIPCDSNETTIRSEFGNGVASFIWNGPNGYTSTTQNPRVDQIGWYELTVTGANGCTSIDSIFVVAQDVVPDAQAETDTLTCLVTDVELRGSSATPDVTFEWSGPNGFMSSDATTNTSTPGTYTLTVRDENGCTGQFQIDVPENVSTADVAISSDSIFCEEAPANVVIQVDPMMSLTTTIDPNDNMTNFNQFTTTTPGLYTTYTVHPVTGCIDTTVHEVVINTDTVRGAQILAQDVGCDGDFGSIEITSVIGGQGPFLYSINNGANQSETNFSGLGAGNYLIQITDRHGCSTDFAEDIMEVTPFSFMLPADRTIQKGQSTTIDVSTNASTLDIQTITWSPATGLSCTDCLTAEASPETTTTYLVTMTDVNGCVYTDEIVISVEVSGTYYVPNAFSPNGDNINDVFMIYGNENAVIESLQVYDRWGEQIFSITNGIPGQEEYGWDGTFNGERVLPGVYVYVATITLGDNTESRQGGVTILE